MARQKARRNDLPASSDRLGKLSVVLDFAFGFLCRMYFLFLIRTDQLLIFFSQTRLQTSYR